MGGQRRIELIDGLRGVAALSVVLYHYVGYLPLNHIPVGPVGAGLVAATSHGHLGVPIFFVLSGYVIAMTGSRYDFTTGTAGRFLLRRLVRLVPPYWVMVILIAATLVAGRAVGFFRHTTVSPLQLAAHLGYVQNLFKFQPLDVAYWTLCLELQFYLVFAATAVAVRRLSTGWRMAVFLVLTLASLAVDLAGAIPDAYFPRWWYQFGVGVLTFAAIRERSQRWMWLVTLTMLVLLALTRGSGTDLVVVGVASLLFWAGAESRVPPSCPRVLLWLGQISYSLYLVHGFIGIMLAQVFHSPRLHSEPRAWLAIAAGTALALAFATAFYHLCERRGIEWSRLVRVGPNKADRASAPTIHVAAVPNISPL